MAFHQNQLQFNTGVPTYTENLSYRHHRPGAIVIEKSSGQQAFSVFPSRQNASYVTRGNGIGNKHQYWLIKLLSQFFKNENASNNFTVADMCYFFIE